MLLLLLAWAGLWPLHYPSRDSVFELGVQAAPATVRLTLGVQDVLLLRNGSGSAQVFGPLRVLPGHVFRLPFEQAGQFSFACHAAPGGQVTVQVVPQPDPGVARLRWRWQTLLATVRQMPLPGPTA